MNSTNVISPRANKNKGFRQKVPGVWVNCVRCSGLFQRRKSQRTRRFGSPQCAYNSRGSKIKLCVCAACGESFDRPDWNRKATKGYQTFCTTYCCGNPRSGITRFCRTCEVRLVGKNQSYCSRDCESIGKMVPRIYTTELIKRIHSGLDYCAYPECEEQRHTEDMSLCEKHRKSYRQAIHTFRHKSRVASR